MKIPFIIIMFSLLVGGCGSSSDDTDYKADLIGTWRSTESTETNYLAISQESFKHSIYIDVIECQFIAVDAGFEANDLSLILNSGIHNYTLTDDTLTITDSENTSSMYERYNDAQPDNCIAPELVGTWTDEENTGYRRTIFKNNQYLSLIHISEPTRPY